MREHSCGSESRPVLVELVICIAVCLIVLVFSTSTRPTMAPSLSHTSPANPPLCNSRRPGVAYGFILQVPWSGPHSHPVMDIACSTPGPSWSQALCAMCVVESFRTIAPHSGIICFHDLRSAECCMGGRRRSNVFCPFFTISDNLGPRIAQVVTYFVGLADRISNAGVLMETCWPDVETPSTGRLLPLCACIFAVGDAAVCPLPSTVFQKSQGDGAMMPKLCVLLSDNVSLWTLSCLEDLFRSDVGSTIWCGVLSTMLY